jgi:hypothetical protein
MPAQSREKYPSVANVFIGLLPRVLVVQVIARAPLTGCQRIRQTKDEAAGWLPKERCRNGIVSINRRPAPE